MSEEEYKIGDSVMILTDNKTLLPYNTALGVVIDKRQETLDKKKTYIYQIKFVTTLANSECRFYARDLRHDVNDYYPEFLTYCKIVSPDKVAYSIIGCKKQYDGRRMILIPNPYFDDRLKWEFLDDWINQGWRLK